MYYMSYSVAPTKSDKVYASYRARKERLLYTTTIPAEEQPQFGSKEVYFDL